jgi:hypothetical protein
VGVQPAVDPGLRATFGEVARLIGVEAELMLAQSVPGGVMAFESPRPIVVVEAALVERPDGERRFYLGRALEPIRGGYTLPLRLRAAERVELGRILQQALAPEAAREPQVQEIIAKLPRKALKVVERLSGAGVEAITAAALDTWLEALGQACDRAGLVACGDIGAAARMLARLGGEELAVTSDGAVALGQVPGGAELVRFFLSDAYHELRQTLSEPKGR